MPFCPTEGCPVNFVEVNDNTSGAHLFLSFVANSTRPDIVYNSEQLAIIHREIGHLIEKYNHFSALNREKRDKSLAEELQRKATIEDDNVKEETAASGHGGPQRGESARQPFLQQQKTREIQRGPGDDDGHHHREPARCAEQDLDVPIRTRMSRFAGPNLTKNDMVERMSRTEITIYDSSDDEEHPVKAPQGHRRENQKKDGWPTHDARQQRGEIARELPPKQESWPRFAGPNLTKKDMMVTIYDSSDDEEPSVEAPQGHRRENQRREDHRQGERNLGGNRDYRREWSDARQREDCNRYGSRNDDYPERHREEHQHPDRSNTSRSHAPEGLQISFENILRQTGLIGLKRRHDMNELKNHAHNPLGSTFDEIRHDWIITDTARCKIVFYPSEDWINSDTNPASVCILEPGKILAVLSDTSLLLFHYHNQSWTTIVETGHPLNFRGLCRTPMGNLATISNKEHKVLIFDTSNTANPGALRFAVPIDAVNPSFCSMNKNRLVVTDLGNQSLTLIEINREESAPVNVASMQAAKWDLAAPRDYEPHGRFAFVSGVQMDAQGWILVADAVGRTVQLFDENLQFITRVQTDFRVPYVSSMTVNNLGQVLFCDRQNNEMIVADLLPFKKTYPVIRPENGPKKGQAPRRARGRGRGQ